MFKKLELILVPTDFSGLSHALTFSQSRVVGDLPK